MIDNSNAIVMTIVNRVTLTKYFSCAPYSFSSRLKSHLNIWTAHSLLQVNLNELDQQMEQIKEMFVKKQEMMKKMSSANAPDPAQLAA